MGKIFSKFLTPSDTPKRKPISLARARRKAVEWFWRYLPAEIAGTITALLGAGIAYTATDGSLAAAAIAGSLAEAVGYYGAASIREITHFYKKHHGHAPLKRAMLTAGHSLRGMITEFGPAEFIDGLFIRPLLLYKMPSLIGNVALGWLVAKLIADVVFYSIAGFGYELRKRLFSDFKSSEPAEISQEVRESV